MSDFNNPSGASDSIRMMMRPKMKNLLSTTFYRLVVPALVAAVGLGASLGLLSYIA
jgi:hypothetical protein